MSAPTQARAGSDDANAAYPAVDEAVRVAAVILQAAGAPYAAADSVARSLVLAERLGHASHGLIRVLEYRESARSGQVRAAQLPVVAQRDSATAVVDGRWGWGHLAARLAASTAADLADSLGVGIVSVRACNHSGRLGEWVEMIASRRLVGIGLLSCGPAVAAFGGLDRVLGTNPIAIAIPTSDRPVVLDFATSGVAEGKLRVAMRAGHAIPPGMVQTAEGRPTTDPGQFYAGGSILPFGAHKGYALSAVIQLLGDALCRRSTDADRHEELANGLVLLAFAPWRMQPGGVFAGLVDECRERIRASRPVDAQAPVLLPGDVEARTAAAQPADRVRVAAELWDELCRLEKLGRTA